MNVRYAKRNSEWVNLFQVKRISYFKGAVIVKFGIEKDDLVLDNDDLLIFEVEQA